ncbi:hypothetical protein B0H14DRAFT_3154691 [Mycena olivaceomarginata]|nr:hypothetical protein B0H14DRAFT_3154691 [Mycena olivaceomarginata]
MSYSTVKHAPADQQLIDSTTSRQLMEFRNYSIIPSTRVKIESAPPSVPPDSTALIKQEPQSAVLDTLCSNPIKIRTLTEGGQEILEILSDTDHSDTDSDLEVTAIRKTTAMTTSLNLTPTGRMVSRPWFALEAFRSHEKPSLVRNKDNDGWDWEGGSGAANYKPLVVFAPGEKPIRCRRAPGGCRGTWTSAQAETRRQDGSTPEQNVAIFKQVICNAKCKAVDSNGNKCQGAPIMKAKPEGPSRGHQYFIACSGFTRNFKAGHQTHSIPDNVDENQLAKALAGQPFVADGAKDTAPCSKFVPSTTGFKQQYCPHPHIVDGVATRSKMVHHECGAARTIYIPIDPSIRKIPHNHPMPTLAKVPVGVMEKYKTCVIAHGGAGATVAKVDNAPSTKVLLGGKTPAGFSAGLHSRPVKAKIIAKVKRQLFPNGTDAAGVFSFYLSGLTKPLPERYIHGYITTDDGGICILTCVPYLLKLLDDPGVNAFDDDTTYKRIEGKMNEWELTILVKTAARGTVLVHGFRVCLIFIHIAATVARAYINRASTVFFEKVFDELQRVKLLVTHKPMPLRTFVPGGNLDVMNADMDGAQILGICRSVMKHNVPEYSGIPNDTPPEQVAQYFVKVCWRHAKEPVHDFRSLVSPSDHARLLDFVYIDSKESLADFSAFVSSLGVKKIQGGCRTIMFSVINVQVDWWAHKEMHEWIIPCLVKSQSRIPADIWDTTPSTTNTNEAQHAWTNSLTGTGRSLAEGISATYDVDRNVAEEIELTLKTGVFSNPHNEVSHRVGRNSSRQSKRARDARDVREVTDATKDLQDEIASELEKRRESSARSKELKEQLKTLKGKDGKKASSSTILSASSSGRVRSVPAAREDTSARKTTTQTTTTQSNDVAVVIGDASPIVATTHIDERAIGSTSVMEVLSGNQLAEGAIHADEYNTLVFLPTPADIQHISDRRPIVGFESVAPVFNFNDSSSSDRPDNLNFLSEMLTWDYNMNAFDSAPPAFNFNDSSSSDSTNNLSFLDEMLAWDFNMNAVGMEYVLADNTVAAQSPSFQHYLHHLRRLHWPLLISPHLLNHSLPPNQNRDVKWTKTIF